MQKAISWWSRKSRILIFVRLSREGRIYAQHETGLCLTENQMTQTEARNIVNKKQSLIRKEKEVKLVYRGTAYKKTVTV